MFNKILATFAVIFAGLTSAMAEPVETVDVRTEIVKVNGALIKVEEGAGIITLSTYCKDGTEITIYSPQYVDSTQIGCLKLPATPAQLVTIAFGDSETPT